MKLEKLTQIELVIVSGGHNGLAHKIGVAVGEAIGFFAILAEKASEAVGLAENFRKK
jgi:hypothetical protein